MVENAEVPKQHIDIKKDGVKVKHRLFVHLIDATNPDSKNTVEEDFEWANAAEDAIEMAVEAAESRLYPQDRKMIEHEYKEMLAGLDEVGRLSDKAKEYYQDDSIPLEGPISARQICDYIFARMHRKYNIESSFDWSQSSFISNPVGVPRTRYQEGYPYNRTARKFDRYTAYDKKAKKGVMLAKPIPLIKNQDGGFIYPDETVDSVNLITTDENYWNNIDPEEVENYWPLINQLHKSAMQLKSAQKNKETLDIAVALVAQIHWWSSQVMFYRRGSAAIADMLSKQIFDSLDIATPTWKVGIAPDLEAYCTDLVEYTNSYHTFFNEELEWSQSS